MSDNPKNRQHESDDGVDEPKPEWEHHTGRDQSGGQQRGEDQCDHPALETVFFVVGKDGEHLEGDQYYW